LRWRVLNTTWDQIRTRPTDILRPLGGLLPSGKPARGGGARRG
jgi:hypothetical protein